MSTVEPNRFVERQRLDIVIAEAARTATDPVTRAEFEAFEALIRTRYKESARPPFESVRDEIADYIMPRIGNPGILSNSRYMEILGHVVEHILPSIGESDDITEIAVAVIEEEMERHRELQDRIYQTLGV